MFYVSKWVRLSGIMWGELIDSVINVFSKQVERTAGYYGGFCSTPVPWGPALQGIQWSQGYNQGCRREAKHYLGERDWGREVAQRGGGGVGMAHWLNWHGYESWCFHLPAVRLRQDILFPYGLVSFIYRMEVVIATSNEVIWCYLLLPFHLPYNIQVI